MSVKPFGHAAETNKEIRRSILRLHRELGRGSHEQQTRRCPSKNTWLINNTYTHIDNRDYIYAVLWHRVNHH